MAPCRDATGLDDRLASQGVFWAGGAVGQRRGVCVAVEHDHKDDDHHHQSNNNNNNYYYYYNNNNNINNNNNSNSNSNSNNNNNSNNNINIFLALSLSLCSHQVKFRHTSMWAPGYKYWALKRFHLEVTRYIYHYVINPQVTNNSRTILNNKIQAEQTGNGSFSMLTVHFLYWIHESSDSPTYDFSTRCWSSLWINCTVEEDSPYFGDSLLLLWVKGDGARRKRSEWSMLPFSKKIHHEHQEKV